MIYLFTGALEEVYFYIKFVIAEIFLEELLNAEKESAGDGTSTGAEGAPPGCPNPYVTHSYWIDEYNPLLWVKDHYGHTDSNSFTLYVVDINLTADSSYICDELVPIHLSVDTPRGTDKVELSVGPEQNEQYQSSIRIWQNSNKTGLIIPNDGQYSRWWYTSDFSTPKTWYVEGIPRCEAHPTITFEYIGMDGDEPVSIDYAPQVDFTVGEFCDCPPSVGEWADFLPDSTCPPEDNDFIQDDCGNKIWWYCDNSNHLAKTAFSWWYQKAGEGRTKEIGMCVWVGGVNQFRYKYTSPGTKRFLKTEHWSCNDYIGTWDPEGEGCWGYWCYRHVRFDCVWLWRTITWHRRYKDRATQCPCLISYPDPTSDEPCPGPSAPLIELHPGWPD